MRFPRKAIVFSLFAALLLGASTGHPVAASAASPATSPAAAPGAASVSVSAEFYTPPAAITGEPGDIIRAEASTWYLDPTRKIKAAARAQRIMYVSSALDGTPTAVTGTVLTPVTRWIGLGTRPLVTYAVGTQGMGDRCAPSRMLSSGWEYEGALIKGLILRGYAVVITDYEGLGTPGVHPYVNSAVLGKNVLDAARAATRLTTDRVNPATKLFALGYSEGGNATAAALEQQPAYAPELNLVAGAAGAVPSDLSGLDPLLDRKLYAAFELYALAGLDSSYPDLHLRDALNDAGRRAVDAAAETCVVDGLARFAFTDSRKLTADGTAFAALLGRADVSAVLGELRLGTVAPRVPVLISHSRHDDVVPFEQGATLARSWCTAGARVKFAPNSIPTHVGGYVAAFPTAFAFLEARRLGMPLTSNCGSF